MSEPNAVVAEAAPDARNPMSHRGALSTMLRAFTYVKPVRRELAIKVLYTLVSLTPLLVLPWPGKILMDHVIGRTPLSDAKVGYPFFMQPLISLLRGQSPATMAAIIFVFLALLVVVAGAWGLTGRDQTTAMPRFLGGADIATQSENQANEAMSYAGGLLGILDFRWTLRLTHRINHHYRSHLFERIQRMPMARIDDQRIGDAIYRVMYDTPAISEVCYRLVLTPIVAPVQIAAVTAVLFAAYGHLPVVIWTALAILPAAFLVTFPFSGAIRRSAERARESGAGTTATIEEGVTNVLAVQSLGGQQREKKRFDADSWSSFGEFRKLAVVFISMLAIAILTSIGLGVFVFFELTDRVFADQLSVGDLWVIAAYYGQILVAATNMGRMWVYLQANVVGMRRVFDMIDMPTDHQPERPVHLEDIREGYRFEDVGFHYPDGTRALKGASFEARRGTLVALAGPAGAGKTTLAYMFPRFLWPSEGRILIDGVDLQDIDRETLRSQTAFVFQEPALFDATIADNIRVGKLDATDEEVQRAARIAGADEFIQHLPEGYDTPLGRNGGRLSVGQKQRMSIARALVRDAPVLILDEPTAALDPETELRLVSALREASRDKLVIVIAHRLSTIRHADQILFLREGEIRERGTHEELMEKPDGAYRRFVELQRGQHAA
ncbi:MAG: ABC transporter ATP-binding protein [Myxococcales bacterium]